MATITVRALSPNNEPMYGNSQGNFISDLDAVVQIIRTRLLLFKGEWFLALQDGLALFQSILGASGDPASIQLIISLISQRILGTPYVDSISSMETSYLDRSFSFNATVETQFGTVYVTNSPGNKASLLVSR